MGGDDNVRFQSVGFCASAVVLMRTSSVSMEGTGISLMAIVLSAWVIAAFIVAGMVGMLMVYGEMSEANKPKLYA